MPLEAAWPWPAPRLLGTWLVESSVCRVSHLRKAEAAFMASAATSSTGLLTASWRARLASPHMAELVNSLISSGCLGNGRREASGWTPIAGPTRNKSSLFLFQSGPDGRDALPLCSPSQDLSKQQQALLVQLCVGQLQASLEAPHHCLNP